MSHRMLPENLKTRIREYRQYKWKRTKGVDENGLITDLTKDHQRDIKRHLRLTLLFKVSASQIKFPHLSMTLFCSCVFILLDMVQNSCECDKLLLDASSQKIWWAVGCNA